MSVRFRLELRHEEVRIPDAFGIPENRVAELERLAKFCLSYGRISVAAEKIAQECKNLNELVLTSIMFGYHLARFLSFLSF